MPNPRIPRGAFARLGFLAVILAGIPACAPIARADPAPAPADTKCAISYREAVDAGRSGVAADSAGIFIDYSGDEAAKLLIGINAFPPVSDWAADHILVFDSPDEPIVVGQVDKGCVTKAFKVPRDDWGDVRRAALGDPS
jgi:hypothetical protein